MDFRTAIAININEIFPIGVEYLIDIIKVSKDSKNGEYYLPCFLLKDIINIKPNNIAEEIGKNIDKNIFEKVVVVGSYVNFFIDRIYRTRTVIENIVNKNYLKLRKSNIYIENNVRSYRRIKDEKYWYYFMVKSFSSILKYAGYNVTTLYFNKYDEEKYIDNITAKFYHDKIQELKNRHRIYEEYQLKAILLDKFNLAPLIISYKDKITEGGEELINFITINETRDLYKYIYISTDERTFHFNKLSKALDTLGYSEENKYQHIEINERILNLYRKSYRAMEKVYFKPREILKKSYELNKIELLENINYLRDLTKPQENELILTIGAFENAVIECIETLDISIILDYSIHMATKFYEVCYLYDKRKEEDSIEKCGRRVLIEASYIVLNEVRNFIRWPEANNER